MPPGIKSAPTPSAIAPAFPAMGVALAEKGSSEGGGVPLVRVGVLLLPPLAATAVPEAIIVDVEKGAEALTSAAPAVGGEEGEAPLAGGGIPEERVAENVHVSEWLESCVPVLAVEGKAPTGRGVLGDSDTVELGLGEAVGVGVGVGVGIGVAVLVGVPVPLALPDVLGVSETVDVGEGLAPRVSEEVGENDAVEVAESVLVGVRGGVVEGEGVGVTVPVADGVVEAVVLGEKGALGVAEGLAPEESVGVGDAEGVLLSDREGVGVGGAVPVPLLVGVPVSVADGDMGGVALPERDVLAVALDEAPTLSEPVGETVRVELPESVELGVAEPVPVPEEEGVAVEDKVEVEGGVLVIDDESLRVAVDAPAVSDALGELPKEVITLGEMAVRLKVGVEESEEGAKLPLLNVVEGQGRVMDEPVGEKTPEKEEIGVPARELLLLLLLLLPVKEVAKDATTVTLLAPLGDAGSAEVERVDVGDSEGMRLPEAEELPVDKAGKAETVRVPAAVEKTVLPTPVAGAEKEVRVGVCESVVGKAAPVE